jgi:hypothetical protein
MSNALIQDIVSVALIVGVTAAVLFVALCLLERSRG